MQLPTRPTLPSQVVLGLVLEGGLLLLKGLLPCKRFAPLRGQAVIKEWRNNRILEGESAAKNRDEDDFRDCGVSFGIYTAVVIDGPYLID